MKYRNQVFRSRPAMYKMPAPVIGKFGKGIGLCVLMMLFGSASRNNEKMHELYRPQFHFTPEKNWMNDPNGLIWFEGNYHMFYQHNPFDTVWGYMHWGHAVSKDLVHWEHLPVAITPDHDSRDERRHTAFSGSAIVDEKNLTGLKEGDQPALLAFYTCYGGGQRLAYSIDGGINWKKYDKNPLIPFDEKDDARDPKVFRYAPGDHYVMVLWRKPEGDNQKRGYSFYSSTNLTDWTFESHLPGFYECPDLVELPVSNREGERRWVIFDGDGSYCVGQFDGKTFNPETVLRKSDVGANYYATQTWSNIPAEDGRTLQIAWMRGGKYPGMPFNGQMTFPCELSLTEEDDGIRLVRVPAREIAALHKKPFVLEGKKLIPGLNKNATKGVKGNCLHIVGTFQINNVNSFGFMVSHSREDAGVEIRFDATKNVLSCLGKSIVLAPEDGKIKLEILLDRTSIELFGNGGKVVMSNCFLSKPGADEIVLYNTGGELIVEKLEIFPMRSMYED